jgi:hypothetical protein
VRLSLSFALLVSTANICGAQELRLVTPLPAPAAIAEHKNLIYKQAGTTSLPADIYLPAGTPSSRPLPVFIVFNGFGGTFMRTSPQAQSWAKLAVAHGFAGITFESTPEHAAEDFDSLAAHLKQHAGDLHLDPETLVAIAWSGNVSAALPTFEDPRRQALKAAIIYYGWADVPEFRLDLPVLFVRAGLDQPITNTSLDRHVAAGIAANAPWTLLNYPGGRHGFDVLDDNDLSREIIEETFRFALNAISISHRSALHAGLEEANAAGEMFTGNSENAAALYREIVAKHPEDARLLLAYGIALTGAKQYKLARTQFDHAQKIGGLGLRDLGVPAARACALDRDPDASIVWLKTIPPQFLPIAVRTDSDFAILKDRADFQSLFHKD